MKTSRIGRWGMVLGIAFLASQVALAGGADAVTADEQSELRQKALSLNDITGDDPIEGQVKDLVADPAGTKKLLAVAVKMAKEKDRLGGGDAGCDVRASRTRTAIWGVSRASYGGRWCAPRRNKGRPTKLSSSLIIS